MLCNSNARKCCNTNDDGLRALYRKLDCNRVFTGIVKKGEGLSDGMFKLDDPHGPLDGPGHTMAECGFLAEMSMYDGSEPMRP